MPSFPSQNAPQYIKWPYPYDQQRYKYHECTFQLTATKSGGVQSAVRPRVRVLYAFFGVSIQALSKTFQPFAQDQLERRELEGCHSDGVKGP